MTSSLINPFRSILSALVLLAAASLPWGCVTSGPTPVVISPSAPIIQTSMPAPAPGTPGSLWQDGAPLNDMFANVKARQVGDIVTVRIVESASASNKATTSTGPRLVGLRQDQYSFFGLREQVFRAAGTASTPSAQVRLPWPMISTVPARPNAAVILRPTCRHG